MQGKESRVKIVLVYDRECPFCEFYCQLVQIEKSLGQLEIVNARDDSDVMQRITAKGLDIDQGMVLEIGDQLYYGADAIHTLALMSSRSGLFNRQNYGIFSSAQTSQIFYPALRAMRNLALKIMRKTRINNLHKPNNEHF